MGNDELGVDPDKDEMIAEVHDRGRGAALTGRIPRAEVYRHLSEADVLVLPTDYEGQPFIIIEALAAGVPIVATDIGSIRSMVNDPTNARLVAREDTAGFATAIRACSWIRRVAGGWARPTVSSPGHASTARCSATSSQQQYRRWADPADPLPPAGSCGAALAGAQLSANSPSTTSRVTVSPRRRCPRAVPSRADHRPASG